MSNRMNSATVLFFVLIMALCMLFASCFKADETEAAKNDVFSDNFFDDVKSAELFSTITVIRENAVPLTGESFEKFKALLAGLKLEKTEENLINNAGVNSITFNKSNGEAVSILFNSNIITLSETESYYCEDYIYRNLMEPFGIGVSEDGGAYALSK